MGQTSVTLVGTLVRGVANLSPAGAVVAPPVAAAPPVWPLAFPAWLAVAGALAIAGQRGRRAIGARADRSGRRRDRSLAGVGLAKAQLAGRTGTVGPCRPLKRPSGACVRAGRDGLGTLPRAPSTGSV